MLPAIVTAASSDSLGRILHCNAQALGGDAAFREVRNLRLELDIREPGLEARATYVASRDGRMRIDVMVDGRRVFAEGLDGKRAWQWSPDAGSRDPGAVGAAALRNGVEAPGRFWTLGQLYSRGLNVEWLEPGPMARPDEWQLRVRRADASVMDYFVARSDCLPTREVSRRAFHPDADPTEVLVETLYSQPERVGGLLRFRRSESRDLSNGKWLGTTVLRTLEHNVELAEGFFEAP
jgi:hypothetical protein